MTCSCACHRIDVYAPHKEGHGCCPNAKHFDPADDTPQPDSPEQIIDEWLDNAMSTSILGWSPIDGYKGHEDNSEAEATKDYDKYKAQALAKLDEYYTNKFLEERLDELEKLTHSEGITHIMAEAISYKPVGHDLTHSWPILTTPDNRIIAIPYNIYKDRIAELRTAIKNLNKEKGRKYE